MLRTAYDLHAAGYAGRLDPTLSGAAERLVELAGAGRGVRLLDLGTGTGTIARAAAARGAAVVGVDASAGMLEIARGRSPQLELRVADASALPFRDGEFDAVTCGLAISHFENRETALAEALRVLRPGGGFVASAWAEGSSTPAGAVARVLDCHVAPAGGLDEETWLHAERGCEVLRAAGFASVGAHAETFSGAFAGVEDALAWALAWPPTAARLARLDPPGRETVLGDARAALAGADLAWRFAFNLYVARAPRST